MAVAMCVPTNEMYVPGTYVEGATLGVDWKWVATIGGTGTPGIEAGGHAIYINLLTTDTSAGIKTKLINAVSAFTLANWGVTVPAGSCLAADFVWV